MEHITYSKVNLKKGHGKQLKAHSTEEDAPTIVYADIRTRSSQNNLAEKDPRTDVPQKRLSHKTLILFLILILIIVLLSGALIYYVYHHKENYRNELQQEIYQKLHQDLCVNNANSSTGCLLCPPHWLLHGDDCYYYSDVKDRTWDQSRDHCKMMGADLVVIKDKEQQEFIQRSLRQWGEDTYWIGEPYNSSLLQIKTRSPGRCISLTRSGYHQTNCNSTNKWICQKKAVKI